MAKQKLKTNSGVKKRFRRTGTGKLVRHKANKRHILTSKSPGRKRRLSKSTLVAPGDVYRIATLMRS
jgi:large subunit ribosomal protein L35